MAKWLDKKMYKAKILFLGSDKEEAAKQATLLKVAYPDKKQEKKGDADKESEPQKRKLANPDKATEPTKKERKTTKAAEKKAQIRAQEKMVVELLAVLYGHGDSDQVEELKRSLEEKENIIKEKEQIIKDKDEELFAMQAFSQRQFRHAHAMVLWHPL
ncbi:uncharacterized protein LOC124290802 [Haliotis rubra]|uniref:uncharacterized protein LOC124290802 n=1 Tax=Haliotis rubra TaxID=36100 RepID=UPI001EE55131|nr:uncharacterized protein LOC124290802 [Haliotis rubra]